MRRLLPPSTQAHRRTSKHPHRHTAAHPYRDASNPAQRCVTRKCAQPHSDGSHPAQRCVTKRHHRAATVSCRPGLLTHTRDRRELPPRPPPAGGLRASPSPQITWVAQSGSSQSKMPVCTPRASQTEREKQHVCAVEVWMRAVSVVVHAVVALEAGFAGVAGLAAVCRLGCFRRRATYE